MATTAAKRNDDIQVLRAVAVAYTLLCHLVELRWKGPWPEWLPMFNYWGGVDLFLCISGFVITGSLLRRPRFDSFGHFAKAFYIRRIFRIWPAALLWLCIPLLATVFFNRSHAFGRFDTVLRDAWAAALQVANVYYIVCSGDCVKEAVYWSLSLEEQFYLLFPFLLFFMRRQSLRYLLLLLIAVQFPLHRPEESALWYLRTDALCYGVLIAISMPERPALRWVFGDGRTRVVGAALACLLLAVVAMTSVASALWLNAGLLAAASACLVKLASFDADIVLPWRLTRPFLLWMGSRSYAIYLVHEPCFWGLREMLYHTRFNPNALPSGPATLMCTAAALVLVAGAGELTYRLVETPLREFGRRLASQHERSAATPAIPA